jgi:amino acid adenylation domain-containing protein
MNKTKKIDRTAMEIAVIGMAGRFPGAKNIPEFWDNLKNGVESITFYSDEELKKMGVEDTLIENQNYVKAGGVIQDTDYFDASFFSYLPAEAEIMDPQMRFFHECSWEALEDAGYDPDTYKGLIGLYAGATPSFQWEGLAILSGRVAQMGAFTSMSLMNKEYLTTKISYKLNLRGPSSFIHTACSTSLAAIHWACRAILYGECNMAVAGAVKIVDFPLKGYMYETDMILSSDGHCRAFDAKASGTVPGSGIGVVVLKRLKNAINDRDHIYAVIKGTAINNDGGRKVGYTAPSVEGQAEAIRTAMAMARVEPDSIGYVETHGTGTSMGDPVEIEALKLAFGDNKKKTCGIGSVKTNIGHLDVAAGAAGFIKTVLALKHTLIPPSLHFKTPNPTINFENSPFYVVNRPTEWKSNGHPLRAGVSSFGIGGTNVHVILEEPPVSQRKEQALANGGYQIIPLSAKSPSALERMSQNLADHLSANTSVNFADMAYTLQIGRQALKHRRVTVCSDAGDVIEAFSGEDSGKSHTTFSKEGQRSPIFMFAGLGSQYVNMGADLYDHEPVFRHEMDRCFTILKSLGHDLKAILYPASADASTNESDNLNHFETAQSVVFVLEYSLAKLIIHYGIKPHAMIGYSLGEYIAASLSGVFSLEDALKLMVARGRLVAKVPTGTMLSVPLPVQELKPFLTEEIAIAIDNGPSCIVAGLDRKLDDLQDKLKEKRYLCMRLPNSHAIHSSMMAPILKEFEEILCTISFNKPKIPYVSNVTGQWITVADAASPDYWCKHLAQTVRFADGVELIKKEPNPIFIEIGPGRDLSTLLVRHKEKDPDIRSVNLIRPSQQDVPDNYYLLRKIGQLWLYGAIVDWDKFHPGDIRGRIPLPTYPFDRHRFWFEGNPFKIAEELFKGRPLDQGKLKINFLNAPAPETSGSVQNKRSELNSAYLSATGETEKVLVELWEEFFGIEPVGIDDDLFELGGDSLKAQVLMSKVHTALKVRVPLAKLFDSPTIKSLAAYIEGAEEETFSFIEPAAEQDSYELSYAQRRIWVLCQFEEDSIAYNMPAAAVVSGDFNRDAFQQTVQTLVDRHEILKTVFITVDGEPRQKIIRDFSFDLEVIDHRYLDGEVKQEKTRHRYYEIANWVFDLEKGPLFRIVMIRLEEGQFLLVINMHHIITDGWSEQIIYREFVTLYNSFNLGNQITLPPLKFQYKDYTQWHNSMIVEGHFDQSGSYWLDKFKDKPNGIELPTDHSRKPVQTFNGGRVSFSISKEEGVQLYALSQAQGATYFMSVLTLLNIFLYKYTGQDDIIVGAPIANRKHPELHNMIGFFVNTLVYRNKMDPAQSFTDVLANIKKEALTSYEYQDFPFDLLMERLEPDRDLSWSPLFNVMIVPHSENEENRSLVMDGVDMSEYAHSGDANISKFDLTFFMNEKEGNEIQVGIEYNSDLFERTTIERMTANFRTLTKQVVREPGTAVSNLTILSQDQYELVTRQFNHTAYEYPGLSLQEIFENQAAKNPDKKAVVDIDDTPVTYHQLNVRVNRIAHYLRTNRRFLVKPNDVIGISMDRSIDMIAVILGVLKSGAAYLAVDPAYPKDRVLQILSDSDSKILIIDKMRPELFGDYNAEILDINVHQDDIQKESQDNPTSINKPSDILYVNYTSGSTGTPNGAMLSHDCLSNLIRWQNRHSGIDCSLHCLQFTSINFCVSFQEIMGTLSSGGELHLIGEIERQDINYLMDFFISHRIGTLFLPFSYLNFLFNESDRWDREFKHHLKHIITAGEQLKITSGLKRFLDLNPGLKLHNHYGSTEMHVVTSYTLDASTAGRFPIPPVGQPVSNVKIYILDENLNPVPVGVWGELFVKGSSQVLGYMNNEPLNTKKLVLHSRLSTNDNIKLYRSGDIGRWMPDGNIELRGRKDFMVKVNGFRVEPGEIESKILAIDHVRECVVVVWEDNAKQKHLVAYLSETGIDTAEIRQILVSTLPQYMIPKIIKVDNLPLMPNGKVDREKLPEPQLSNERQTEIVPPRNDVEKKLAQIWAQLIEKETEFIGIDDNFFELGGHSLKAITMMTNIEKELDTKIELTWIFTNPTIRNIASLIETIHMASAPVNESETGEKEVRIKL